MLNFGNCEVPGWFRCSPYRPVVSKAQRVQNRIHGIRHGPHHAAQKSTSTGPGSSSTSRLKLYSSSSILSSDFLPVAVGCSLHEAARHCVG